MWIADTTHVFFYRMRCPLMTTEAAAATLYTRLYLSELCERMLNCARRCCWFSHCSFPAPSHRDVVVAGTSTTFKCICEFVRFVFLWILRFFYGGEYINLAINVEYQEGDEEKLRENEARDVCAPHSAVSIPYQHGMKLCVWTVESWSEIKSSFYMTNAPIHLERLLVC